MAANKPPNGDGTSLCSIRRGSICGRSACQAQPYCCWTFVFIPRRGNFSWSITASPKVLTVDPQTGALVGVHDLTGEGSRPRRACFDAAGNVYMTDAHRGKIWRVGKDGGKATVWVASPLLKPNTAAALHWRRMDRGSITSRRRCSSPIRARHARQIPVTGEPLKPGKPEVFVNRVGGGPGRGSRSIDEHDNIWVACNQSNEILVIEPTQGA